MKITDAVITHLVDVIEEPDFGGSRYELRGELGRGGMGVVYVAYDRQLMREVAVKVVAAHASGAGMYERMLQEARIIAGLEHPGIVPIHDAGTLPDGRIYYAMKLVRGTRLDAMSGTPTENALLDFFLRICDAVAFAHDHGIVHRDLKPENIMIGAFGEVLVMDWGIAKRISDQPDASGGSGSAGAGTHGFMSPEQESGRAVDGRSDVYSLGAVLRFMMKTETLPPRHPLRSIVQQATTVEPDHRYGSVLALADDVRRFLDRSRVIAHRESFAERAARWIGRYRVPIAVVLAYLTMRLLLFLWLRR